MKNSILLALCVCVMAFAIACPLTSADNAPGITEACPSLLENNVPSVQLPDNHPDHPQWNNVVRTGTTLENFIQATADAKPLIMHGAATDDLPEVLDNSIQPYFRGIFQQVHGSCSQASAIGYIFTYEINWARNLVSDSDQTRYPSHFTYNFLNNGLNFASDPFFGWNLVTELGVPNQETFGGLAPGDSVTYWMNGYDKYYSAMQNRIYSNSFIEVNTEAGLEQLKQWFDNHATGADVGGLALFGANTIGTETDQIPAGTPEEGKFLVKNYGPPGQFLVDHLMTFVGYDDRICYDYNGDGRYTNDEDTNGDGSIDMTDWEIGALIIANSWSSAWGNDGFIYLPYRLLAIDVADSGIGLFNRVFIIDTLPEHEPLLAMKISLTHDSRNKLRVIAGVAAGAGATEPDCTFQPPIVNFQGGANYMQGGTSEADKTLEFGIDVSPLLDAIDSGEPATFFLEVVERDNAGEAQGSINAFSVMDYTGSTPVEIASSGAPLDLVDNDVTRIAVDATINFDHLEISDDSLPPALEGQAYTHNLAVEGGTGPFTWQIEYGYNESTTTCTFPAVDQHQLTPDGGNDDGVAELELGFAFPFFLETVDTVYVTTDGSITFDENFTIVRSKGNLRNSKAITPLGTDLLINPESNQGIFYEKHEDHVVVRWLASRFDDTSNILDFAATIHKSGKIDFCYAPDLQGGFNFAVGISDGVGHNNISDLSGAATIPANHQIRWTPCEFIAHPVYGMELTSDGVFQGIPSETRQAWTLLMNVIDVHKISHEKEITFMCSSGTPFYTLNLHDMYLSAGETFHLSRVVGNPDSAPIAGIEYLALEVYNMFWFWPSWNEDIDSAPLTVNGSACDIEKILEFEWPEVEGSAEGLRFWGAMVTNTGDLVDYTMIEWSYN